MTTATRRRVIPIDDSGVVFRAPAPIRRSSARASTPPAQRAANQVSLVQAVQSVVSTVSSITNLIVSAFEAHNAASVQRAAHGNTQIANSFLFAQTRTNDSNDPRARNDPDSRYPNNNFVEYGRNNEFREIYQLGEEELSRVRLQRQRLMRDLAGDTDNPYD